ncbi:MAG: hypothetical protein K5787_08795 [Lentisphaeria bacterium]|nr:hypothetical protein [Victivallales bacterium]MBR6057019.1 hypothetical protein [Victivallales bacterium]MCR4573850.1 hypothetical protein [Lentisphaeria bacterium]
MARATKYACPCCGRKRIEHLGDYEICDVCGWEDDPTQSKDPDFEGGANELSLKQARAKWRAEQKAKKEKK